MVCDRFLVEIDLMDIIDQVVDLVLFGENFGVLKKSGNGNLFCPVYGRRAFYLQSDASVQAVPEICLWHSGGISSDAKHGKGI